MAKVVLTRTHFTCDAPSDNPGKDTCPSESPGGYTQPDADANALAAGLEVQGPLQLLPAARFPGVMSGLILDSRGGKGPGSGRARSVHVPPQHRGSSNHVGTMTPWGVGSASPEFGAPIGRVQKLHGSGATVCCDPINWFERAKLINNPSSFTLGLPNLGKSTLQRRWILYYVYSGVIPLILGDLKPDYVDLIRALNGQVITLGRAMGALNILDMGDSPAAARLLGLSTPAGRQLMANAHARRQIAVESLIAIQRTTAPEDHEISLINRTLAVLDKRFARRRTLPILSDMLALIKEGPEELQEVTLSRGDAAEYRRATHNLETTLVALTLPGGLGDVFNQQTTVTMLRDRPAVIDIHFIEESDTKLRAAALIASWTYGFGQVSVSNFLADAGVEPQRRYFVVQDELWQALSAGTGLVDRINALSRLNRQQGVGEGKASHTMDDLKAIISESDRAKAAGLVERSGMQILFGLPHSEMDRIRSAVKLTNAEAELITSWSTPPSWNAKSTDPPPGRGKCLIKVGNRPGIPVDIVLTPRELAVNDTNKRWKK